MSTKPIQLVCGERFGRLVVVDEAPRRRTSSGVSIRAVNCLCDCGKTATVDLVALRHGNTRSCGCGRKINSPLKTHGMGRTQIYWIWQAMKDRCLNPSNAAYHRYGGRGIRVTPSWIESFESFLNDVGPRPSSMTLERIDNDGNYEPGNVRWASAQEQRLNTCRTVRVLVGHQQMALSEACKTLGLNYKKTHRALRAGTHIEGIQRV